MNVGGLNVSPVNGVKPKVGRRCYMAVQYADILAYGLDAAIFLADLRNVQEFMASEGQPHEWITSHLGVCERRTGLPRYRQNKAINTLIAEGAMGKRLSATMPRQRQFRINEDRVAEIWAEYDGLNY